MTTLDNSNILMYDFYYNKLKRQYGENCELIYTDTDSLLLNIQTDDIYKNMEKNKDLYDTSDYPEDHFLHSKKSKKVLGNMKDEMNGKPISECVCLRSKMYSIMTEETNIKKAKGVKKRVIKKEIKYEMYKEALENKKTFQHGMNFIQSEGHEIYGIYVNKTSLSPFDSKRWIAENGIDTVAYGHRLTDEEFEAAFLEFFMD